MFNLWSNLRRLLRPVQAELQHVDQIARTGEPLRGRESHETPVFVVIIEAGIKDAVHAKPPRPRNQPEGSEPPLRARDGHIVARGDFPFVGKLSADKQPLDSVWVWRKIQFAGDDALEGLI